MSNDYTMSSNGLFAALHMPQKLEAVYRNGEEVEQHLPPAAIRRSYLVDKYPGCPKDWMRSEGKATSYFVPVKEDYGMWLDFNNLQTPYHVACVVSVQGVNAVTGLPVDDVYLEQYIEECPKHKTKFGPNRFCEKCNYKWPKQNYIATTGTPAGMFWIDGFRAVDGAVRQYVLTQDKMKGVANAIIGEKRVFAIGISFFLAKDKHRNVSATTRGIGWIPSATPAVYCGGHDHLLGDVQSNVTLDAIDFSGELETFGGGNSVTTTGGGTFTCSTASLNDNLVKHAKLGEGQIKSSKISKKPLANNARAKSVVVKKVEIGAGAKIRQAIYDDPESIDFWRKEPEAIIYVNYALEADVEKILAEGEIDLEGSKEGFLGEVPLSI